MRISSRYLKWFGYPLLYVVCFVLFAYAAFPYERLKQRIVAGYNAAQLGKAEPRRMQIGELTWSWRFPGVVLSEVELIGPKPVATPPTATHADDKAADAASPAKPARSVIHIDEVYASASLLSLLTGTTHVDFEAEGFNGRLRGDFASSDDGLQLNVTFEGVDPGQLPGIAEVLQLPLAGTMNGTLSADVPEGKYSKANGHIDVTIDDLKIGDGKTLVRGLFALPTVDAGTLTIQADVAEGKATVERFEANGPDLEVKSDGRLRLRDDLAFSVIEQMNLMFRFSDKYRDKDDTTRSLLGKPGDKVSGVIDLDPQVKRAKQADNSYQWKISGPVTRLRFTPGKVSTPPKRAPRRAPRAKTE